MSNPLEFFTSQGHMTSPGEHARLLDDLPGDVKSLCQVVQGLLMHVFWAEHYGVKLSTERAGEVQLRSVARSLGRILELDPRPLVEPRQPADRLVGNCRHFSVMLATMLRHRGVPARARCGFGHYFLPDHYEDHWVCEYWNAAQQRWVLVDAQLDELQCRQLSITFDPLDVPRDQFITAGKAWRLCRTRQTDPEKFGIFDMHGLWFIRGNLVRDVASLNKVELLPWDGWGIIDTPEQALSADDLAMLDRVAELVKDDVPEFDHVQWLYENDHRLRVPGMIHSYTQAGVQVIDLDIV
jgi:hypothetical protein